MAESVSSNYWKGTKASPEEVVKAAMLKAAEVWPNAFHAETEGNSIVNLWVECEEPDEYTGLWDHFTVKYMGWRLIITKCPIGYIDCFLFKRRAAKKKEEERNAL